MDFFLFLFACIPMKSKIEIVSNVYESRLLGPRAH